jgi:hypothetical protein
MLQIDLLSHNDQLQIKRENDQRLVRCLIRQKYLLLTPEEMVRQLWLHHLIREMGYPKSRIAVEKTLRVNQLSKRFDILVFDSDTLPWMLIECKAPQIKINQDVFDQVARYNLPLRVPYLVVSNGPVTYCSRIDYEQEDYDHLPNLPSYE